MVAQWFLEESLGLVGEMATSKVQRNAANLLDWLKKLKQDDEEPLKLSDLLQIGPRCIRSKKERDAAVEILCNYGYGYKSETGRTEKLSCSILQLRKVDGELEGVEDTLSRGSLNPG